MKIRGLIFDFDGVIVDTEYAKYITWQEIFNSYGVKLSFAFIESVVGNEEGPNPVVPHLEELIGRKVDGEKIESSARKRFLGIMATIEMRPGVLEYFEAARALGLKMAIASNAGKKQITPIIERLGIGDYFECVLTKEDVKKGKPHPEIIELALSKLGLAPDEALAFDDSNVGLQAAKNAGVRCIGVQNEVTKHFKLDAADRIVGSMEEMGLGELVEDFEEMF